MQRPERLRTFSAFLRHASLAASGALAGCAAGGGSSCQAPCTSAIVHLAFVDGHAAIPLEADGNLVEALLDTGAFASTVTEKAAVTLNARPARDLGDPSKPSSFVLSGFGGDASAEYVTAHDLLLAGARLRDAVLVAAPSLHFDDPRIAGLVGGDLLQSWDLDLDVGRGLLNLDLPQRSSPVAPWHGATTRIPFDGGSFGTWIRIQVMLDGHPLQAIVDTGAPTSLVSPETAAGREMTATDRHVFIHGVAGLRTPVTVHHFGDLSIGGLSFGPIDAGVGDIHLRDVDMVIGLDVLRMARVYVAYGAAVLLIDEGGS